MRFLLGHFDQMPLVHSAIVAVWRFIAQQSSGDPQGLDFFSDFCQFLLFHPEYFRGIFHRSHRLPHIRLNKNYTTNLALPHDSKL